MKRLTTILAALFISAATFAQAPQGFSYQAVVRDAQNAIVANQTVEVTVTILQGADANAAKAVFSEKHNAKTNANGLFTLTIGSVDAAKFAAINWADGNLFLKTESEYGTATTQLLSVPFAMYAAKAGSADVDLSEYAKKTDIPAETNLEGYAKTADVDSVYAKKSDLPVVPTIPTKISDLENDSDFLTEHQSLAAYAKTAEVDSIYAKKSDIPEAVDLSGYYSKADVDALLAEMNAKIKKLDKQLNPQVGAIEFAFSVSRNKKVYFSKGNLQYQASTSTWRFAENQWNFVGDASYGNVYENEVKCNNANVSEDYEGWIDLFGWGTSGYNNKNPYMTSKVDTVYGDGKNDIEGTNYDWGVYNAISNGGNQAGLWRTLTYWEWEYLITSRIDAKSKYGAATVNGVKGLILLPDEWTLPIDFEFVTGENDDMDYSQNIYSINEWAKMEANGAVFLPAAGRRIEKSIIGNVGCYTTTRHDGSDRANTFYFIYRGGIHPCIGYERSYGRSVRLVQDVEE